MIEIQELIIQARVEDGAPVPTAGWPQVAATPAEQEALIERIAAQVLASLRDQQEDWA
ncbi:DUF5908 family protein [Chromobacterium haemolyticum]|uniref:DUF5908 family protein n=1 Tax=Chromobacterium haemolyticum TaxID=394935 RepID=UPI0015945ECD|nr:DUF5908 family protein [Chromobacterium haemolyticum]